MISDCCMLHPRFFFDFFFFRSRIYFKECTALKYVFCCNMIIYPLTVRWVQIYWDSFRISNFSQLLSWIRQNTQQTKYPQGVHYPHVKEKCLYHLLMKDFLPESDWEKKKKHFNCMVTTDIISLVQAFFFLSSVTHLIMLFLVYLLIIIYWNKSNFNHRTWQNVLPNSFNSNMA